MLIWGWVALRLLAAYITPFPGLILTDDTQAKNSIQADCLYAEYKGEALQLSTQGHQKYPFAPVLSCYTSRSGSSLLKEDEAGIALLQGEETALADFLHQAPLYLGTLDGMACLTGEVNAERPLPIGWRTQGLRGLFRLLDERVYELAGYALQILRWQRESRYCPRCGRPLGDLCAQWARHCTNCSYIGYPPVTPAMMVLVHDGERMLLARNVGWKQLYSVIAGFVEPGETLENCVRREVAEEVGLSVSDITYVGSQPWPFPHQLMIGFTARYAGGQLCPDPHEIADAGWFSPNALPDELPGTTSLAWRLISGHMQQTGMDQEHRAEQPVKA